MYKALLWDIDGTVLNFLAAEKAAIRKCFQIFNLGTCTDEMLDVYSRINVKYWEALERGDMTKTQILVGRFSEFFSLYGIDATYAEKFNAEYQIRLGDTICFYDDAFSIIAGLKGKVLQCAVTNGTKIAQERKLKESGLDKLFDKVYISEVVGVEKPGVEFFEAIFNDFPQYSKEDYLIIGDSLTSDIKGGNNAKIATCWFNPNYKAINKDVSIDYEISNLAEVLKILNE